LLELVGLGDLHARYAHQLSGGQQQRVALARALAVKPDVVLLDEPFASLDAQLRTSVREDVRRILGEAGTTTLLVTHNQDEALSSADLVAVIRDGRVVQHATPRELYSDPADKQLAKFVGDANLLSGVLSDGNVQTVLGRLPIQAGETAFDGRGESTDVTVLVRPEQIMISAVDGSASTVGEIIRCDYHGHDTVVSVQLSNLHDGTTMLARVLGHQRLAPGQRVALSARGPVPVWPE
jgi:iron(III) transport system ATP-binding protein